MIDLYSYCGGFGILAAQHGATQVTMVDSSASALALAKKSAQANDVQNICEYFKENVFDLLPQLICEGKTFDIVAADPPAFVKEARFQGQGLRGYQKLAKLATQIVAPGGLFFIASCSHHAQMTEFRKAVETGISKAGRQFTFLRKGGADKDHPVHPMLPQTHYLKSLAYQLD
jgi:23S rRNA (cytosine1962-C5)-methyltransferase